MTAQEWIGRFAAAVGEEPPEADEVDRILNLAAVAAHSSERIAAPVACWIAGRTGRDVDELRGLAEGIGGE